jgi:hypothetical protein
MHLVSDYIHPYKHAGDISHAAAYGSTSLTMYAMLQW